jgi:flagellar basal body rod protein FlgC
MATNSIQSIARAALRAARNAFRTSAENVANANTPGHEAKRTVQLANEGGPVTETTASGNPAPVVSGADGLITLSNTDLVEETLTQSQALAQFKAAAKIIETADEMDEDTLDLRA